jgi:hypothetical protein
MRIKNYFIKEAKESIIEIIETLNKVTIIFLSKEKK